MATEMLLSVAEFISVNRLYELSLVAGGSAATMLWNLWSRRTGVVVRLKAIEDNLLPSNPDSLYGRIDRLCALVEHTMERTHLACEMAYRAVSTVPHAMFNAAGECIETTESFRALVLRPARSEMRDEGVWTVFGNPHEVAQIKHAMAEAQPLTLRCMLRRADGKELRTTLRLTTVPMGNDRIAGFIMTLSDFSQPVQGA